MAMRSGSRVRVDQQGFTLAELLVVMAIVALIMAGLLTLLKTGNESYLRGANQVEAQSAVRATLEQMTQEIREAGYNPQGLPACAPPLVPGGAPPWPCMDAIVNATATSFTIWNDWNGSGCIQGTVFPGCTDAANPPFQVQYFWGGVQTPVFRGEQINYQIVGNAVCRQESQLAPPPASPPCPAGFQPLVTSVAQANFVVGGVLQPPQPFFQYRDANGTVIALPIANPSQNQANIRTVEVNLRVGVQNTAPVFWQAGAVQVTMSDRIRLRNRIP